MLSLASRMCFVAAVGLLVWALVQMASSGYATASPTALFIDEPEQDLGELPVGVHMVAFRVQNTSRQPQQIVGMAEG